MEHYLLTYDIGSTSCKTCLYSLGDQLKLAGSASASYSFHHVEGGGVEQNPEDWWKAMAETTRTIMAGKNKGVKIEGISFCAQMQGLILVDKELKPLRPAMSYMDQRAVKQKADFIEKGIKVEGMNLFKLLKSLRINGAVAASVKDPVYKYHWVRDNEPEIFGRIHKWLDVKDYLIARATGVCSMTADSAFATFLTGNRDGLIHWSPSLINMYKVNREHLPDIVNPVDCVGGLLDESAAALGLEPGIPVFGVEEMLP